MILTLAYRPPLDWAGLLAWYALRTIPGVEEVTPPSADDPGAFRLALSLPHRDAAVTLTHDPGDAVVRAELRGADRRDEEAARVAVRRLLDLDADPHVVDGHLARVPVLGAQVRALPGIRVPGTPTPLEALLRALTGQQVSVASGRAQLSRLVADVHGAVAQDGALRPFPTAEELLEGGLAGYRGPRARLETLRAALRAADQGALATSRDPDDVAHDLGGIKGIGPWTVAYTLMRGYGAPDVDLATDRALLNAASALGIASPRELLDAARPWRSYAALHLWRHASGGRPVRAAQTRR